MSVETEHLRTLSSRTILHLTLKFLITGAHQALFQLIALQAVFQLYMAVAAGGFWGTAISVGAGYP